ncbi:MAG: hypothetical protein LBL72_08665 [Candidatus Accumulibacter sp.]|jgi:hypothetical protein|nr:hypothetical protein [Accumulibacter sp.]
MFPFEVPENTAALTCRHVLNEGRPILFAFHDDDDDWQFLCGGSHAEEDAVVVTLKQVFDRDPSIEPLASLPEGMSAERETPDGQ